MLDVINDLGTLPAIDDATRARDLLVVPVIGDAAPADERERLERCNDFTLQLNVAKVGIANGNLIVTADHVVMPETDLSTLFQLTVNLVLQVVSAWFGSWDQGRHEAPETGG